MIASHDLRALFLDFFRRKDHVVVPSSKVIPEKDPTLLFTNAGMNQFKEIFLGRRSSSMRRAASVQKCIRASGKHNDLEDVGRDGRHHTFFEMLGNWSFGDYYKREAIVWAWEFLTEALALPPDRLWVSVYTDDEEAFGIWEKEVGVGRDRIVRLGNIDEGDEENFWSMGETGPCGPSSEVYYQYPSSGEGGFSGGIDDGTIVEIWNLVFMEFNRQPDGTLTALPRKNVDTGMGLERTLAVLQGVHSNYETDLFAALLESIQSITKRRLTPDSLVSFQVLSDHIRALSFAVADGATPSNEGRGYVLRRILRRAVRHGRLLGMDAPFIHRLLTPLIDTMGEDYPELAEQRETIETVIRSEEELFLRTLDRGLEEFERAVTSVGERGADVIPGEEAFLLHDTFGFPLDLTRILAEERGLSVDQEGFDREMEAQRERAKGDAKFQAREGAEEESWTRFAPDSPTVFLGYETTRLEGMKLLRYRMRGDEAYLVFDRTPFYAESGGQVGDTGVIEGKGTRVRVDDVQKSGDVFVHIGKLVEGEIRDVPLRGTVDEQSRRQIMANHTATHLLHHALRSVIGDHARQAGSLVAPERLRFDFNHYEPVTREELAGIERMVNQAVLRNLPVTVYPDLPLDEAKRMGATALFGEKYGERVRVVQVEGLSAELCGGTHAERTGDIGLFRILKEGSISSGIRRIEAVTNLPAYDLVRRQEDVLNETAGLLGTEPGNLIDRVRDLQQNLRDLRKKLKQERKRDLGRVFRPERDMEEAGSFRTALLELEGTSADEMREILDRIRAGEKKGVVLMGSVDDGKVTVMLAAGDDAVKGGVHAGKLLGELLSGLGGKGGGRPHLAQGGGIAQGNLKEAFLTLKKRLAGL